jgi:hypothetical protein
MVVNLDDVRFSIFPTKDMESPYQWKKLTLVRVVFGVIFIVKGDLDYMHFRAVCPGKQAKSVTTE